MTVTALAPPEFKTKARILKALAHPTRLFMVDELSRGERCVRELTELVGVEMPTVSRHLALLRNAGIVVDEKRGSQVFYRLRVPCVLNFFKCLEAVQRADRNMKGEPHGAPDPARRLGNGIPSRRNGDSQEVVSARKADAPCCTG